MKLKCLVEIWGAVQVEMKTILLKMWQYQRKLPRTKSPFIKKLNLKRPSPAFSGFRSNIRSQPSPQATMTRESHPVLTRPTMPPILVTQEETV